MIRAIIFDFDGVIMVSMNLKMESYRHSLAPFNFEDAEVERLMQPYWAVAPTHHPFDL